MKNPLLDQLEKKLEALGPSVEKSHSETKALMGNPETPRKELAAQLREVERVTSHFEKETGPLIEQAAALFSEMCEARKASLSKLRESSWMLSTAIEVMEPVPR